MLAPISIIIPTYNDAHYLVHCLDSILKQSLLPSEVIVIDDGSKDHSAYDVISSDNFSSLNIKFLKIECFKQPYSLNANQFRIVNLQI
jgi:glycosyltransferase involved in cell wall biosynthesis